MLIRFEKYSLYFLQQSGKAILCCLLPWGSSRKNTIWKWFLFLYNKHIWCLQANTEIKAKLKPLVFMASTKLPFYASVSAVSLVFSSATEEIKTCSGWWGMDPGWVMSESCSTGGWWREESENWRYPRIVGPTLKSLKNVFWLCCTFCMYTPKSTQK